MIQAGYVLRNDGVQLPWRCRCRFLRQTFVGSDKEVTAIMIITNKPDDDDTIR